MRQGTVLKSVPITLPRLVGTRGAAERLVDAASNDYVDMSVHVFGRQLVDASPSFTDELVLQLQKRGASEIVLFPSPDDFVAEMRNAADKRSFVNLRMATDEEIDAL